MATSDSTYQNLGVYNGALIKVKAEGFWLIIIHCANHRLELVIKDAAKGIVEFAECDKFYTDIYYLFKNAGKWKTEMKEVLQSSSKRSWLSPENTFKNLRDCQEVELVQLLLSDSYLFGYFRLSHLYS